LDNVTADEGYGGYTVGGAASGNQIWIRGGAVKNVYGGHVSNGAASGAEAKNNTITLTGEITMDSSNLYGYYDAADSSLLAHEGNALNLDRFTLSGGSTIDEVKYFDQYNFKIAKANVNDATKFALVANTVTMGNATIGSIEITGGGVQFKWLF
jgi:hypothetical protein